MDGWRVIGVGVKRALNFQTIEWGVTKYFIKDYRKGRQILNTDICPSSPFFLSFYPNCLLTLSLYLSYSPPPPLLQSVSQSKDQELKQILKMVEVSIFKVV